MLSGVSNQTCTKCRCCKPNSDSRLCHHQVSKAACNQSAVRQASNSARSAKTTACASLGTNPKAGRTARRETSSSATCMACCQALEDDHDLEPGCKFLGSGSRMVRTHKIAFRPKLLGCQVLCSSKPRRPDSSAQVSFSELRTRRCPMVLVPDSRRIAFSSTTKATKIFEDRAKCTNTITLRLP